MSSSRPPRQEQLLREPFGILIREIAPVTPLGLAPKTVVGDQLEFSALLVAEGHGLLGAQLRVRRADGSDRAKPKWTSIPMVVEDDGTSAASSSFAEPGLYEFEVQAWWDRFGTWSRDLRLRAEAGDDLAVEFEEGALILSSLIDRLPKDTRPRVIDAVEQLRSTTCTDRVRLAAALDDALAVLVAGTGLPSDTTSSKKHLLRVDRELAAHGSWYEFFPRSEGGFTAGAPSWERLERIAEAGFDVLYLPPIHPIGVSHRKGRDNTLVAAPDDVGSPWAIGSGEGGHTEVHPELGTIDDVRRFVAAAAELGVEVALDYALQCSPDHPWVAEHPEWFQHRADGSIRYAENPPKKYQDIYPIDFWPASEKDRLALWQACRDVLEFWIECGVHVFRVDNPHTKPLAFWLWLIADVQSAHPEIVFLSEAFTDPAMMHSLAEVGFSQSYTYFTWRHAKWELEAYGDELAHAPAASWFRPNLWPNTPDILAGQLRDGSPAVFAQRALLAATLAPSWGVYSGYEHFENDPVADKEEYHFSEKYEVRTRDHEASTSLWPFLSRLNHVRRAHPAFWRMASLKFHFVDNEDIIAYSHQRTLPSGEVDRVLMIVNLLPDELREGTVYLDHHSLGLSPDLPFEVLDELTGESWIWSGTGNYVRFDSSDRVGHVFSIRQP